MCNLVVKMEQWPALYFTPAYPLVRAADRLPRSRKQNKIPQRQSIFPRGKMGISPKGGVRLRAEQNGHAPQ